MRFNSGRDGNRTSDVARESRIAYLINGNSLSNEMQTKDLLKLTTIVRNEYEALLNGHLKTECLPEFLPNVVPIP
jgi:hypothetical protein